MAKTGLALDVGSTSIAAGCICTDAPADVQHFSFTNPQTQYGADIMTRIRHCMDREDMLSDFQELTWSAIRNHLEAHTDPGLVDTCVVSANTTMQHFLRKLPVDGLAAAPFTPVTLDYAEQTDPDGRRICFLPGFSAFVGADILAGAHYLKMGQHGLEYDLLIDLGTNGEMLLLNQAEGFATSTACGSVFDSALTGAAYGSECIHILAMCLKRGLIHPDGVLADPYFEKGISIEKGFVISQDQVRRFQLAKAAIYAGIQCLMDRSGIDTDAIGHVYISGGLGFYTQPRDAIAVKMLPAELKSRITVCGNTSLAGAETFLTHFAHKQQILSEYESIRSRTNCFELANHPGFQEFYIHAMNF